MDEYHLSGVASYLVVKESYLLQLVSGGGER